MPNVLFFMKRTMTLGLSCRINVKVVFILDFLYDWLVLGIYFLYLIAINSFSSYR